MKHILPNYILFGYLTAYGVSNSTHPRIVFMPPTLHQDILYSHSQHDKLKEKRMYREVIHNQIKKIRCYNTLILRQNYFSSTYVCIQVSSQSHMYIITLPYIRKTFSSPNTSHGTLWLILSPFSSFFLLVTVDVRVSLRTSNNSMGPRSSNNSMRSYSSCE